ncbi:NUDIX hydrolase [Phycicoccus sonneratiae]|uniref:NUDIX domain-containing protein n=1 Tax=Phycicoccus sonneratiae TaxID=2807628 RepID=A0ABS2CQ42_9MICO|nr:NUDIX domain-containing protein [Phycicoccus sonneraticus]MBM6402003.1 NUDIX domain-containing protein [Phycicoccus sonneraticus]
MIVVRGERGGAPVVEFVLGHGEDPVAGLAARGWSGRSTGVDGVLGRLVLRFEVVPVTPLRVRHGPHGPGLATEDRAVVRPHQRVAAYAVVVADERLLLTQLAPRTGADGRWNLPGGGLEPGESVAGAVVREVLEETGQVVDDVQFVDVMTQHWVGRSERGAEDYHAVRLVHTARCTRPTRPVVHDVGGSTSDARWVPLDDLGAVPVVASIPAALRAAGVPVPGAWPQS